MRDDSTSLQRTRGAALPLAPAGVGAAWRTAQVVVLFGTAGLVGLLAFRPAQGLRVLWAGAVPVLPAVLLVQPALWRNVCPLATLSLAVGRPGGRGIDAARVEMWTALGAALLYLVVPARLLLFDGSATAAILLIVGATLAAVAFGVGRESKAGFCNAMCPMLPVERLYGQAPVLDVSNVRCATCTTCTPRGCLDLAGGKAIAQVIGPARRTHHWLLRPFGLFAASFPGLVGGWFLLRRIPDPSVLQVYGGILVACVVSWALVAVAVRTLDVAMPTAMVTLAAVAAALFYWFTIASIRAAWSLPVALVLPARVVSLAAIGGWWIRRVAPALGPHPS